MDAGVLRQQILRTLRGSRSQQQLSRRLRFNFNQVYRWESGQARLYWPDFAHLCQTLKADLNGALDFALRYQGKATDGAALISHLIEGRKIQEAARVHGVSRFKLQRWLSGDSKVPFEIVMQIIAYKQTLLSFVERIVPPEKVPELAPLIRQREVLKKLFTKYPAMGGVLVVIQTEAYQKQPSHQPGWIGRLLGISIKEENEILQLAEEAGLIDRKGKKYVPVQEHLSTHGFPEAERHMRSYWIERGLEFENRRAGMPAAQRGYFGHLIMALNSDQERRIQEALVQFTNRMIEIATEPTASDARVYSYNLQFFNPWSDERSAPSR